LAQQQDQRPQQVHQAFATGAPEPHDMQVSSESSSDQRLGASFLTLSIKGQQFKTKQKLLEHKKRSSQACTSSSQM
jgi:hypothetical protein